MALRLVAASKTDPGLQREQNEDACHIQMGDDPQRAVGLFIVADGMGGYHAGEVASRLAVETIRDDLQSLLGPRSGQPTIRLKRRKSGRSAQSEAGAQKDADDGAHAATDASDESPDQGAMTQQLAESLAMQHFGDRLREAVEHSSKVIVRYGRDHSDAHGLGSTLTAVLVVDGQAYIANVGDSRTYLLRDGMLQHITRDHSLVARLVEAGQIEPDEVYDHPNRNLIYRSLGAGKADVEVDIFTESLRPGDMLLLCSDGLWEMVRDPELEHVLTETRELEQACELLIERANDNGGEDNITAVLVRCDEG
jgi:serine/threonine protein phosphatase PrpC